MLKSNSSTTDFTSLTEMPIANIHLNGRLVRDRPNYAPVREISERFELNDHNMVIPQTEISSYKPVWEISEEELFGQGVSFFKKVTDSNTTTISVGDALKIIGDGSSVADRVRGINGRKKRQEYKIKKCPAVMWGGYYPENFRSGISVIEKTNLIYVDVDCKTAEELEKAKEAASRSPHLFRFFTSISGNGLGILFVAENPSKQQYRYFAQWLRKEGVIADMSCSNAHNRLNFLSYDPDVAVADLDRKIAVHLDSDCEEPTPIDIRESEEGRNLVSKQFADVFGKIVKSRGEPGPGNFTPIIQCWVGEMICRGIPLDVSIQKLRGLDSRLTGTEERVQTHIEMYARYQNKNRRFGMTDDEFDWAAHTLPVRYVLGPNEYMSGILSKNPEEYHQVVIKSQPGTGKTMGVIFTLEGKKILAFPTLSTIDSVRSQILGVKCDGLTGLKRTRTAYELVSVFTGETKNGDFNPNAEIILTTYASLKNLFKRFSEKFKDRALIIDEIHTLVTSGSPDYMGDVNRQVSGVIKKCINEKLVKSVIGLTGTPVPEMFNSVGCLKDFKIMEVDAPHMVKITGGIKKISKGINAIEAVCILADEYVSKGILPVIYYNSLNTAAVEAMARAMGRNVIIINSTTRKKAEIQELLKGKPIPEGSILLVTSALETGTSINMEVPGRVVVISVDQTINTPVSVIQLSQRIRNATSVHIDRICTELNDSVEESAPMVGFEKMYQSVSELMPKIKINPFLHNVLKLNICGVVFEDGDWKANEDHLSYECYAERMYVVGRNIKAANKEYLRYGVETIEESTIGDGGGIEYKEIMKEIKEKEKFNKAQAISQFMNASNHVERSNVAEKNPWLQGAYRQIARGLQEAYPGRDLSELDPIIEEILGGTMGNSNAISKRINQHKIRQAANFDPSIKKFHEKICEELRGKVESTYEIVKMFYRIADEMNVMKKMRLKANTIIEYIKALMPVKSKTVREGSVIVRKFAIA